MRILAFTDFHAQKNSWKKVLKKVKDADILVGTGDFSDFGKETNKILSHFKDIGKPVLVIHGNHETIGQMKEIEKEYENIIFLHKRSYQLDKYLFFGFGGGGFSQEDKDFENVSNRFLKTVDKKNIVIMLTHSPPYGTKLDFIEGMGHRGNESYTMFIKKNKPLLWICGHIHETFSQMQVLGNTVIANPGPEGKIIEI
ncbi:MAG: metallophosphoesterase [Nanoarchaeota archaeon]|nr:metallophosphoesterase [Nanoarchaeota archaeon]